MIKDAHERAINRKLTIATKGAHRPLDTIQIPIHKWFYSEQQNELYQYERGNFKAYPPTTEGTAHTFKTHHTLKVLPPDAILVNTERNTKSIQITGVIPNPTQTWRDVTTPSEMERLLLERNKRHLQQTIIEGGTSNTYPMPLFRREMGINKYTDDLLRGHFTAEYEIPPPVTAWIKAVTQTDVERALPEVVGSLSMTEFQQMFKRKKEGVSSDPHGINYTVWKAMAKSDHLSSFLCSLVSLPFIYGFANTRWMNMIDVMLEKKPGVRNIHMLRIIGLVCPEFNTALSYFIGHLGQRNFEQTGPTEEQHGSRRNRQSIDAAMLKLLTMETARAGMRTIAMTQYDEKNCFDRIFRQNSNIFAQKAGISKNILTARTLVKDNMKRRVKTGLGITEGTYHQVDGEPTLDGEIQGTADTPLLFSMLSNVAIQAHKSYTPGLTLESPTLQRQIQHHNIAYVDDADGHVSADHNSHDPTTEATQKMNLSAQGWNDVNNLTGGSLAYHKTKWQMIAWEETGSTKQLLRTTTQKLRIKDWTGAPTTITFGPSDEPNVGLGFHLCPNGNQHHQFEHTHDAIHKLCKTVATANLTEQEALQAVTQRLVPKLHYPLHLTSFTRKQTDKINSQVRRTFLPPMRFNRHLPAAVLYGPASMGGMEFPETYTMQDQAQIPYLLKQLRWDKTVANDILVTLDHIQLTSGFVLPILSNTLEPINYIDNSFLLSIRNRLSEINGSLWIEKAWSPPLQREGDSSIMENFTRISGITTSTLKRANTVRIYLRVITIADLANPEGTAIPDGMLNGDWQAGTDLLWPRIPCPPKPYWATFRKCIRATYCTLAPQHQPAHYSVSLDKHLGPWYSVKRNTWHQCYKSQHQLYLRQLKGSLITVLSPSRIKGYYHSSGTVKDVPIDSHPITHQQIGNNVWTQRPMNLSLDISTDPPPPGHLVNNTLTDPRTERLILGSDGSLHLHEQVAAAAWIVSSGPQSFLSATFIMENINSLTSHRIELEGIFRALHHLDYLNMTPKMIDQWCDNLQAVKDADQPIQDPSGMLKAEADIILAIHHIKNRNPYQTRIRHVYGHQDTKISPQTKLQDNPKQAQVLINIACDKIATDTSKNGIINKGNHPPLPPILQPPYEGSRAMLRINDTWITSHYKVELYRSRRTKPMEDYLKVKYNWTDEILNDIYWPSIKTVRHQLSQTKRMQTCKIMHGWLPVMHMRHHVTGLNQCPGCKCTDETIDHFLKCPHPKILAQRKLILTQMKTKGIKLKIPKDILNAIVQTLAIHTETSLPFYHKYKPEITTALKQQYRIGPGMMARGYLSKHWLCTIHPSRNPPRVMTRLQRLIWMDFFEPLWKNRNDLLHQTANPYTQEDDTKLSSIITEYCKNRHTLLSHEDTHLADNIDITNLDSMPTEQKREWVRHFDTAKELYNKEKQRTKQKTIFEFMSLKPKQTRARPQKYTTPQRTSPRRPKNPRITRQHNHDSIRHPAQSTYPHHIITPPRPPKPR